MGIKSGVSSTIILTSGTVLDFSDSPVSGAKYLVADTTEVQGTIK